MRLATVLHPESEEHLQLAAQCGVTDMVTRYGDPAPEVLRGRQRRFAEFGLRLSVVEGDLPIERIKVGIDDGTDCEAMKRLIRSMGELEIPLLCYNFMAGTDWVRTRLDVPERGGAKVTAFDLREVDQAVSLGREDPGIRTAADAISSRDLWQNLTRMLDALLPIAESAGVVLCMHPDDPPLAELAGKPRIMHNIDALERLMALAPSPHNAICFCQGTFAAMGVDIPAAIRRLGNHIQYVHFRDVRGTAAAFAETFHDNGPTDMAAAMAAYRKIGFDGPIRADHVPQLVGDDDGQPGYTTQGRLFAWGYMRGLMQATEHDPVQS